MTGRPSPIDQPIGTTREGDPITVATRIEQLMRIGFYLEPACDLVGVPKATVYGWLKIAGQARLRAKGRNVTDLDLTNHENRCLIFSDAVLRATAEWEARVTAQMETAITGGLSYKVTTTKTEPLVEAPSEEFPEGRTIERVVERTVREVEVPPNMDVLKWRLTRRFPQRYADRIEVADDRATPDEGEHASALVESLEAYLEGVRAAEAAAKPKRGANGKNGQRG